MVDGMPNRPLYFYQKDIIAYIYIYIYIYIYTYIYILYSLIYSLYVLRSDIFFYLNVCAWTVSSQGLQGERQAATEVRPPGAAGERRAQCGARGGSLGRRTRLLGALVVGAMVLWLSW